MEGLTETGVMETSVKNIHTRQTLSVHAVQKLRGELKVPLYLRMLEARFRSASVLKDRNTGLPWRPTPEKNS